MRARHVARRSIDAHMACSLACYYRSVSQRAGDERNSALVTATRAGPVQTRNVRLTSSGNASVAVAQASGASATGTGRGRETVWQVPGKHRRVGGTVRPLRAKKRPPWGVRQLRDSWSEDAMTECEKDSLGERIHRRYRYHPDESIRQILRWAAWGFVPMIVVSWCVGYYRATGKAAWRADPQYLLNLLRIHDTSPRSRLYLYQLDECTVVPEHIRLYRALHWWERQWAARLLRMTQSAFTLPNDDLMRQLAADLETEIDAAMCDARSAHASEVRFDS